MIWVFYPARWPNQKAPRVLSKGAIWTYEMMTRGGRTFSCPKQTDDPAWTIQTATRVTQKDAQRPFGLSDTCHSGIASGMAAFKGPNLEAPFCGVT